VLLGDQDREQLYERLKRHAAAGRIDVAELERRVEAIATATTHEQAAAVMADLPALPSDPPPGQARRRRGHGEADRPQADWQPTNERFRDPRTNRIMRVWEDAAGARHYVPDG
jgi:Domain of unknown function (DUF1707)